MRLSRLDPFAELRTEMERLQRELRQAWGRNGAARGREAATSQFPPVNLSEDHDHYYVEAELPGLDLNDLEIYVTGGDQLSIGGERKSPLPETVSWHRQERGYGKFNRSFTLPAPVDAERVEAELKNGVLRVKLPKREEVKPRRVQVKVD